MSLSQRHHIDLTKNLNLWKNAKKIIQKDWCKQIQRKVGFTLHSECRQGGPWRVDVQDTTHSDPSPIGPDPKRMGHGEASPTLWR